MEWKKRVGFALKGKKQWLKLNSALSKVNSIDDVKNFMELETDQRHKCRKEALTKKMEQTEWKALKATSLVYIILQMFES